MFVSHERSPSKKTFQKPNILRRKTKVTTVRAGPCRPPPPPAAGHEKVETTLSEDREANREPRGGRRVQVEVSLAGPGAARAPPPLLAAGAHQTLVDGTECGADRDALNVEAFLNVSPPILCNPQNEAQITLENHSPQKWQIDFGNGDKIIMEPYECSPEEAPGARGALERRLDDDHLKGSESGDKRKLRRGERGEARTGVVACPAWRGGEQQQEQEQDQEQGEQGAKCGRLFPARALLAAHLSRDHTPDDAPHRCGECGRQFFWAAGLLAHARAHRRAAAGAGGVGGAGGAALACGWPGCGRSFRLPCRLREHARAHTGDRPYPCRHPGCGWAFRTASKLLRHARRHTGERRHRCACGRAFRRREHLRQHQARRRPPCHVPSAAAAASAAASASASAATSASALTALASVPAPAWHEPLLQAGDGGEARAARTHCTWPLAPEHRAGADVADVTDVSGVTDVADVTDVAAAEHAEEVVMSRGLSAVRSDLFLPASAAHNDDSQQMGAPSPEPGAGADADADADATPPHAGLGLLDLMQEELMYSDAVDGSSFQVLLLSEELG